MDRITDFHSHILPKIDDGSSSVEESVALLRLEAEQDVPCVIATPHFYAHHDNLDRFLQRRSEAEQTLRQEMRQHTGLPEVRIGAEVHYFRGISDSSAIKTLTIDAGPFLLVEMPLRPWEDKDYRELERLHSLQGLTPILAHVERYLRRFRSYAELNRLLELPVLLQANASCFLSGRRVKTALQMLEKGQIHLLGSDCHNLINRRPNLAEAVQVIQSRLGNEALDKIRSVQQSVLSKQTNL